jgi:S-adenosylmethionine decarboxylase
LILFRKSLILIDLSQLVHPKIEPLLICSKTIQMNSYTPGLHIICDAQSDSIELLKNYENSQTLLNQLLDNEGLTKIGEVYHNFEGGGFTGVICLTESHISIHTWPEYGKITFDVFLSNYQKVNDQITHRIYEKLLNSFKAVATQTHEIKR